MGCKLGVIPAVIANGASQSSVVELQDGTAILGFTTDAAFDTQAITFLVGVGDSREAAFADITFTPLFAQAADGTFDEATVDGVAASRSYAIPEGWFKGFDYVKLRSGTAAAAANQSGATTISVTIGKVL